MFNNISQYYGFYRSLNQINVVLVNKILLSKHQKTLPNSNFWMAILLVIYHLSIACYINLIKLFELNVNFLHYLFMKS